MKIQACKKKYNAIFGRWTIMYQKFIIYLSILVILLMGCSANIIRNDQNVLQASTEAAGKPYLKNRSDKDLIHDALLNLRNKEKEPNYIEAKAILETLVRDYPNSQWVSCANVFLDILEKYSTLQGELAAEREGTQTSYDKILKENEVLRDKIKENEDRYRLEIAKLEQENEKLKNDIQQLKELEVQLERREKMLR